MSIPADLFTARVDEEGAISVFIDVNCTKLVWFLVGHMHQTSKFVRNDRHAPPCHC